MRQKRFLTCLVFTLLFCSVVNVYAKDIKVIIEGEELETDTPPVIMYDRVMLPVRTIFEGVGARLAWDGETKTLIGVKDDHVVVMKVGSEDYTIDDKEHTMGIAPVILDGRTFASARYVAEAFGYKLDWDQDEKTVAIYKEETPQKYEKRSDSKSEENEEKTTAETTVAETTAAETTTEETTSTPVSDVSASVLAAVQSDLRKAIGNYSLGIADSVNSLKPATIRACKSNWDSLAKTSTDKRYVSCCKQFYDRLANTAKRIDTVYHREDYQGIREVIDECIKNREKLEMYSYKFLRCSTLDECKNVLDEMNTFYSGIKTRYYEYED